MTDVSGYLENRGGYVVDEGRDRKRELGEVERWRFQSSNSLSKAFR